MSEEVYKPINNYPQYEVSNFGNVRNIRSKDDIKILIDGEYYYENIYYGQVLKPIKDGDYLKVNLMEENSKNFKANSIHRLVAEHFMTSFKKNKRVKHRDLNNSNNHIDNLFQ